MFAEYIFGAIPYLLLGVFVALVVVFLLLLGLRVKLYFTKRNQNKLDGNYKKIRIAFFHPKCHAGGGGEKVLWCMIDGLYKAFPGKVEIAIYTGGSATDEEILNRVKERFNIDLLKSPPIFVRVKRDRLIDPDPYPYFTMLGQIFGTMVLATESVQYYVPDYFIDTIGLAFSFWIVKFLLPSCKVGAYVHYPFVSQDMLNDIVTKKKKFNNRTRIADSAVLSAGKYYYYKILIYFYGLMGNFADFAWANSTWTCEHIKSVWPKWGVGSKKQIGILYPPCNLAKFGSINDDKRKNIVLSFAQYRPEKNQRLQLEVFKQVLDNNPKSDFRFFMIGSTRGKEDEILLANLKSYAEDLGITSRVDFFENLSQNGLLDKFSQASYGIHTMESEHFGIAIVEMMAAGLVTIAHNTAGPKLDIIKESNTDPIGFLASSKEDYIQILDMCLKPSRKEFLRNMTTKARSEMQRFSDEKFKDLFAKSMSEVFVSK